MWISYHSVFQGLFFILFCSGVGYGQEGGSITVKFTNTGYEPLTVVYLEVVPWYLRLFLHTSHSSTQLKSSMSRLHFPPCSVEH